MALQRFSDTVTVKITCRIKMLGQCICYYHIQDVCWNYVYNHEDKFISDAIRSLGNKAPVLFIIPVESCVISPPSVLIVNPLIIMHTK